MTAFIIIIFTITVACIVGNAHPITNSSLFQGDIKLLPEQSEAGRTGRLGWVNGRRWPKVGGYVTIPYTIRASSGYTTSEVDRIKRGLYDIQISTCIRFVQRTNHADYLEFFNGGGCWSHLGKTNGRQELSLARPGCLYEHIVTHEVGHALGFHHMQNAYDRDNYIRVAWENIDPSEYKDFDKFKQNEFNHFGTRYDLVSTMHYPAWAFGKNGKSSMFARDPNFKGELGVPPRGASLSAGDIQRFKIMYQC